MAFLTRRKQFRLLAALALSLHCPCLAWSQGFKEYQVKAVLLLNLTRFVDWPESAFAAPDSPVVIGIVGHDPFGATVDDAVHGERVNGRSIVVQPFQTAKAIRRRPDGAIARGE